jgi:hypothetical protein
MEDKLVRITQSHCNPNPCRHSLCFPHILRFYPFAQRFWVSRGALTMIPPPYVTMPHISDQSNLWSLFLRMPRMYGWAHSPWTRNHSGLNIFPRCRCPVRDFSSLKHMLYEIILIESIVSICDSVFVMWQEYPHTQTLFWNIHSGSELPSLSCILNKSFWLLRKSHGMHFIGRI